MSRFDGEDGEIPWPLWEKIVSNALTGQRGQAALAELETALLDLPEKKLIHGNLAGDGSVCAVGALVASKRAAQAGTDLATEVERMNRNAPCSCRHQFSVHADGGPCTAKAFGGTPCTCDEFHLDEDDYIYDTVDAGRGVGLRFSVAWHLAYLNDEQWAALTDEARYEAMLEWVRKAQGKEVAA